jgi:hypothetical protein
MKKKYTKRQLEEMEDFPIEKAKKTHRLNIKIEYTFEADDLIFLKLVLVKNFFKDLAYNCPGKNFQIICPDFENRKMVNKINYEINEIKINEIIVDSLFDNNIFLK